MKLTAVLFLISVAFELCGAYKILVIFPNTSKSHGILGEGYVRHLLKAGHEITYITAVPIKNSSKNLRQIDVSSNFKYFEAQMEKLIPDDMLGGSLNFAVLLGMISEMKNIVNNTISNEEVQKLMFDPNTTFDVVIAEWLMADVYAGFSAVFDCPLIWSTSTEPHSGVLTLIDEMPNPSYAADNFFALVPPFTILDRAQHLVVMNLVRFGKWCFQVLVEETIYENHFAEAIRARGRVPPTLQEVKYNASLMLGNSHASIGVSISLPQNYKAISGYHINEEVKPLPEKYQKLMDNSKDGVIYFSLGSIVPSNKLPDAMKRAIVDFFGSLKQTVIWKLDGSLSDLPKNVHIVEWAPQQSILAHPNCVLFITHGGLLSITEAVYYGKPIIGVPAFGDQPLNVLRAVQKGYALEVLLNTDLPGKLKVAVEEMLSNSRYAERAKEISHSYHHRVAKPGDELVHWVEHVIQTKGAPELRSPALHVPWYQKQYLDLLAVVVLIIYVFVKIVKFLCCRRGKKQVDWKKYN